MPAVIVYDANGRAIELIGAGVAGGEGTVYRIIGNGRQVAKIYHAHRIDRALEEKLRVMLANQPDDPTFRSGGHRSIAWIDGLLYADRAGRELRGFTMPLIDTTTFRASHVYYDADDRVRLFGGGFTWRHLLIAARNLSSAVAAVHASGHRIGDLRETNVLVAPTGLVSLIDCDSFEIHDPRTRVIYPTRVATGDYLAPELHGVDFGREHPDRYHADLFALAVLVFRFVMLGAHPFQARGPAVEDVPSTEAKIRKGLFVYPGRVRGAKPPQYAPPYASVPRELKALFARAFVDGHGDPTVRPKAQAWADALGAVAERARVCSSNAHHVFDARACPWCQTTRDPFPAPVGLGMQVALSAPAAAPPEAVRLEQVRMYARVALADGPVTDAELAYLRTAGTGLGLRVATIDRLVDDEARRTFRPAQPPCDPPRRERLRKPWHAWRDRRVRSAVCALAPMIAIAALAGAIAPVIAPLILAVVGLPLLATVGEGRLLRGWRARARIPLAFLMHLHRMLGHAARVVVPVAVLAAGLVATHHVARDVALSVAGATAAALIVWSAAVTIPTSSDRSAPMLRAGRDLVWRALAGESGRTRRPALAVWSFCVLFAGLLATSATLSWPFRS